MTLNILAENNVRKQLTIVLTISVFVSVTLHRLQVMKNYLQRSHQPQLL